MEYQEFALLLAERWPENKAKNWRKGQHTFNLLNEVRPDLAASIRGSLRDPFHQDNKIEECLLWVQENWQKEQKNADS